MEHGHGETARDQRRVRPFSRGMLLFTGLTGRGGRAGGESRSPIGGGAFFLSDRLILRRVGKSPGA